MATLDTQSIISINDALKGLAKSKPISDKIAAHLGHTFKLKPNTFAKHVYCALYLDADTIESFASRFVVMHCSTLKYVPSLIRFQTYHYDENKVGDWFSIREGSVHRVIQKNVDDALIEPAIRLAAKDAKAIRRYDNNREQTLLEMVRAIKADHTQITDIANAMKVVLKRSIIDKYKPIYDCTENQKSRKVLNQNPNKPMR